MIPTGKHQTQKQEKYASSPTMVLDTKHVGFSPTENNPNTSSPVFEVTECELTLT